MPGSVGRQRVSADRAAHAAGAAAPAAELGSDQRDHLDAVVPQHGVGRRRCGRSRGRRRARRPGSCRRRSTARGPRSARPRRRCRMRTSSRPSSSPSAAGQVGPALEGDGLAAVVGGEQPQPGLLDVEERVGDERVDVDHRDQGVQVHRRAGLRHLHGEHPLRHRRAGSARGSAARRPSAWSARPCRSSPCRGRGRGCRRPPRWPSCSPRRRRRVRRERRPRRTADDARKPFGC